MWRLLLILVGLGAFGPLIPWSHVAGLVLSDSSPTETRARYETDPQRHGLVITRLSEPSDRELNVDGALDTDRSQRARRMGLLPSQDGLAHVAEITFWSSSGSAEMMGAGGAPAAPR